MTNKLSYPGLKCVLEYLEANRRIHITARSPALRKIEKSVPIHLEFLMIEDNNVYLNDIEMTLYSDNQIEFKREEKEHLRQLPIDLAYEKAVEKMNEYYLGGRMSIYADYFWFLNRQVDSFPKFNVTTSELNIYDFRLDDILQYINPNSFPLKEIKIKCIDDLNHPHICSAKKLLIEFSDEKGIEHSTRINAIQHKNVELIYDTLTWTDVMGIIRYWMENGKETDTTLTGTTFVFCGRGGDRNDEIMTELRNEFSEILSKLTGVHDQNIEETPGFSIPLTTSSKIFVYGRRNTEGIAIEEIVLKVVSSQADGNIMEMDHQ